MLGARRWTELDGLTVRWGNIIGGREGQRGTYQFSNEQDAKHFAVYAGAQEFLALDESSLRNAGIAEPVSRNGG